MGQRRSRLLPSGRRDSSLRAASSPGSNSPASTSISSPYLDPSVRALPVQAATRPHRRPFPAHVSILPLKQHHRRQPRHKRLVSALGDDPRRMPKRNGIGIDLLADPTRRRLVSLIALGLGQPSKLAKELGLSRPATSRQLRILARAELITSRRGYVDRRKVIYFIEARRLGQITAWLAGTEVGRAFPQSASISTRRGIRRRCRR